jgi:hypothetical protein
MRRRAFITLLGVGAIATITAALVCPVEPALAQFTQQGPKLVGGGGAGQVGQGRSVALSGDGNTAIVGGPYDNGSAGAVWVFTRSGGVWTQQGNKLVGTGAVGPSEVDQGVSVALSGDGNTAIVGGPCDNASPSGCFTTAGAVGAAWVFTRSGGVWSQQGNKLVGSGAVGNAQQGSSVALSGDGNTAIVGGYQDNSGAGAVWVFTRSGGVWTQQQKLVGSGAVGNAQQGNSVALLGDGNTAIIGGYQDNSGAGAVWVFTRSGGVWSQQGNKLVGSAAVGNAGQGGSVSLSADGNTVIMGGSGDNMGWGAAWGFTRCDGGWSQQGNKLVAALTTAGVAHQGASVALSGDGNTAFVGGPSDNGDTGAVWVFTRSGGVWTQQQKLVGSGAVGNPGPFEVGQGSSVALSADGSTAIVGGPGDSGGGLVSARCGCSSQALPPTARPPTTSTVTG